MPSKPRLVLKRLTDIVFSGLALVLLSPLFLGLAVFIKLRSPGPVFFRQTRVGLNGQDFSLLKFRSMHSNAAELPNTATTRRADPRVFRGGQTIRKYKLDELPQIVNVLLGDMSLVGPRPTVREDHQRMTVEQRRRVSIRPGLSGLAQISGGTTLNWPQRIVLDLEYIDNLSFWNDTKIIARTVGLVISGQADTHPATDDEWNCATGSPKIICLGMNQQSAKAIAALVSAGADICAIAGLQAESARDVSDFVDLAGIASIHGITFLPVSDVNAPETLEAFHATGADMVFVLGWGQALDKSTIETFPFGAIISHVSKLEGKSAMTLLGMTGSVEDATILKQAHFDIPQHRTAYPSYGLVSDALARSIVELYRDIAAGRVNETETVGSQAIGSGSI